MYIYGFGKADLFCRVSNFTFGRCHSFIFLASIFIANFSCFILKEAIGLRRIGPIILALVVTEILLWPLNNTESKFNFAIYILPKLAAFCYAMAQILTEKLGANTKASIMAFYMHLTFLIMTLLFYHSKEI